MKKPSSPIPTTALLGSLTATRFLREYWHKKPLLIRRAIPDFRPPVPRDDLFALAGQEAIESRLITHFKQRWDLRQGPFAELPPPSTKNWTLLVQGVNQHLKAADRLLRQFNFLPDARLDDLMISYASDGGGVGPHFDSYDVFLLQAYGKRQWQIGAQADLALVEGMPLKILQNFKPQQSFVLEPGDMLYLPPQYAHDGVAIGECMTYSIGFRAPSFQELGEAFLQFMADSVELPGRYADPGLKPQRRPAEISKAMLMQVSQELNKLRFTDDDIAIFLGEYLSEPKASVIFDAPQRQMNEARFLRSAGKRGLVLSLKTQMLYRGKYVFINGESFAVRRDDKDVLQTLADQRRLEPADLAAATDDVRQALHCWYQDGWLELG